LSLRKRAACVGVFLVALAAVAVAFLFVFGSAIVNGYVKGKVERAFAKGHPGFVMRIGHLGYVMGANEVVAQFVTVTGTNAMFKADEISLMGVRWVTLLRGKAALADIVAKASLDATILEADFPQARYGVRCARLRASVPNSEFVAEEAELRTLVGDNEFFAAHDFRTTRFHVVVPECRVLGVDYGELFGATSYRAGSIQFTRPIFEALVDRYKPVGPFVKSPLMVHEALAAILQPLRIDSLGVTNGSIKYSEQMVAGANPGALTFTAVSLSAEGIANHGAKSAAITLQGQGNLMDAGMMKVQMSIPIMPTNFSLHYAGSLSAMNLTNLDAFLDIDAHTRITSGAVKEADFEIDVAAGQARGHVRGNYQNLDIAFLDKESGAANGLEDRVTSFLANMLKIRSSNNPEAPALAKEGEVNYTRRPNEEFQQFLWFALRTGVLDIISH
jgi:hypothetical protein